MCSILMRGVRYGKGKEKGVKLQKGSFVLGLINLDEEDWLIQLIRLIHDRMLFLFNFPYIAVLHNSIVYLHIITHLIMLYTNQYPLSFLPELS